MSKNFVISVMSKDRPGIVADVTSAIYELNGDLADLNQSVLCGYFTMILIAKFRSSVSESEIVEKLSAVNSETKLEVVVKEAEKIEKVDRQFDMNYILTAQGENKSGLVAQIGNFCKDFNINILDLGTTLKDELYTMILLIDLKEIDSISELSKELKKFGDKANLNLVLQHEDIFKATTDVNSL